MTTRRMMFGRINKRRKTALVSLEGRIDQGKKWWLKHIDACTEEVAERKLCRAETEVEILRSRIK